MAQKPHRQATSIQAGGINPLSELQASAIAPTFLGIALEFVPDLEIDPITCEVLGTPLDDALGRRYTRFGLQHKANEWGYIFRNENETVWQVKRGLGLAQTDGRTGQYLAPTGCGNQIYTPAIPPEILDKICDRAHIPRDRARRGIERHGGFWPWVLATKTLPILVTEGAKKALAALSQGHVAIALYGCRCGGSAQLIPYLEQRPVTVAFDQDVKPKAIRDVQRGIATLAGAVARAKGTLTVATWRPDQGKGLDDLLVQSGQDAFEGAIQGAIPYALHKARKQLANPLGQYSPNLWVNVPCLTHIDTHIIPTTGLVIVQSGMGTGKTKLIARLIAETDRDSVPEEYRAIAPGHRISLQQGLAKRLGLDYISDTDQAQGYLISESGLPTRRVSLCWNSLLKIPVALYDDGSYDLILDEVDQGFKHLFISSVCGTDGMRPGLVQRALTFMRGARRIIAASATLTKAEIDLLIALRNESPWILRNDYQGNHYPVALYTGQPGITGSASQARGSVLSDFMTRLDQGERGAIATDQKTVCKMLERLALATGLQPHEILRIDQDTSGNELQREFLSVVDKVAWLRDRAIRLLLYSPSMTSGVSIEGDYFHFVGGIFEGQTVAPDDALQQLGRVRATVPRIVYVGAKGRGDFFAETRYSSYLEKSRRRAALFTQVTGRQLPPENEPIAQYIATVSALRNGAMADFAAFLRAELEAAGHEVTLPTDPIPGAADAAELWRTWREEVREQDELALLNSLIISPEQAQELRAKKQLPYPEALQLRRFDLCDFMDIHPELLTHPDIKQDGKGRSRRAITRLEHLLWDNLAQAKDTKTWDKLTLWNAPVQTHDLPYAELSTKGAEALGIPELIESAIAATEQAGWHQETPWVEHFAQRARVCAEDVQLCLGFRIHDHMSAMQIVGMVLAHYGLKTACKRIDIGGGVRVRVYRLDVEQLDWLKAVLQRRAQRLRDQGFDLKATPLTFIFLTGMDSAAAPPETEPPLPKIHSEYRCREVEYANG